MYRARAGTVKYVTDICFDIAATNSFEKHQAQPLYAQIKLQISNGKTKYVYTYIIFFRDKKGGYF